MSRRLPGPGLLARAGFTILEVMVALGLLAVALVVLIDSQATSVIMTLESERIVVGTMLAEQKLAEVELMLETQGFSTQDIEEEGDFSKGVFGEFMPGGMDGQFDKINSEGFEDYRWAFTVREIDLSGAGDIMGAAESLSDNGYPTPGGGGSGSSNDPQSTAPDLGDMGVSGDMISEMLNPYLREVRVLVWWGSDEPDPENQVELTCHMINPTGALVATQ